jgi:hypothetical protein
MEKLLEFRAVVTLVNGNIERHNVTSMEVNEHGVLMLYTNDVELYSARAVIFYNNLIWSTVERKEL